MRLSNSLPSHRPERRPAMLSPCHLDHKPPCPKCQTILLAATDDCYRPEPQETGSRCGPRGKAGAVHAINGVLRTACSLSMAMFRSLHHILAKDRTTRNQISKQLVTATI